MHVLVEHVVDDIDLHGLKVDARDGLHSPAEVWEHPALIKRSQHTQSSTGDTMAMVMVVCAFLVDFTALGVELDGETDLGQLLEGSVEVDKVLKAQFTLRFDFAKPNQVGPTHQSECRIPASDHPRTRTFRLSSDSTLVRNEGRSFGST